MADHSKFWQRPVTDTLVVELVPGDQPGLRVNDNGHTVLGVTFSEARALIEVLTVAVGELLILKKDPAALDRLQRLLAEDVTLETGDDDGHAGLGGHDGTGLTKIQRLLQRYKEGGRSFYRADLRRADLREVDLRRIDLRKADLAGANLKRANLFLANLEEADLSQANLEEAGLFQANLCRADLRKACLKRAFLCKANLRGAKVSDKQLAQVGDLTGAILPDGTRHG